MSHNCSMFWHFAFIRVESEVVCSFFTVHQMVTWLINHQQCKVSKRFEYTVFWTCIEYAILYWKIQIRPVSSSMGWKVGWNVVHLHIYLCHGKYILSIKSKSRLMSTFKVKLYSWKLQNSCLDKFMVIYTWAMWPFVSHL